MDKRTGKKSLYPLIQVNNVFVFPGIPDLLRRAFDSLGQQLFGGLSSSRFHLCECFVTDFETAIADRLSGFVARYPAAAFGSYPEWAHNYYKTKITIETDSKELSEKIRLEVEAELPTMVLDKEPWVGAWDKIQSLLNESEDEAFNKVVKEGLDTVEKAFTDYGPAGVVACFNGGKDCIAMLHLVYAHFDKHFTENDRKLQTVYIKDRDPFPEVEEFILATEERYDRMASSNLDGPMKPALTQLLSDRPAVKAAFLGTRMGDPGSQSQGLFSPTDGDWPRIMRVNPVLNWEYAHVWKFVRGLCLPYPSLYDQGYTSLGSKEKTKPNPALAYKDEKTGREGFRPAYELEDGEKERNGRK